MRESGEGRIPDRLISLSAPIEQLLPKRQHPPENSARMPPRSGRVNGCAVLRFAAALRVTRPARCGQITVKGRRGSAGPIESGPNGNGPDSSGAERLALTGSVLPAGKRPAATRPTTGISVPLAVLAVDASVNLHLCDP